MGLHSFMLENTPTQGKIRSPNKSLLFLHELIFFLFNFQQLFHYIFELKFIIMNYLLYVGSITSTESTKRKFAYESLDFNCKNK